MRDRERELSEWKRSLERRWIGEVERFKKDLTLLGREFQRRAEKLGKEINDYINFKPGSKGWKEE